MSPLTTSNTAHHKNYWLSAPCTPLKKRVSMSMIIIVASLVTTGCSTTHELKPTATVIVGGHKSI